MSKKQKDRRVSTSTRHVKWHL